MKTVFVVLVTGVPAGKLSKLVEFLNGINCLEYEIKSHTGPGKKPHYAVPRTFKMSTTEDREKMYRLAHVDKRSPESIAKEMGFSVVTVKRYIKKRVDK